jgi:hypothetical protein
MGRLSTSSRSGQKYRNTSISVDVDVEYSDIGTLDLVDELLDRAEDTRPDPEARAWVRPAAVPPEMYAADKERGPTPGARIIGDDLEWTDVETALNARDFDALARWLWPQVKARWPRPILTKLPKPEPAHG